ncbi:glycosyltransferase family 25 protein [Vibrio breoganii]
MIDIYYINLDKSIERKAHIESQLKNVECNVHRFPATNGHMLDISQFDKYNSKKSKKYRKRELNKGQLGCFSSHYNLWKKCIEINKPILIIEDDIIIHTPVMNNFIESYKKGDLENYECIRLFNNRRRSVTYKQEKKFFGYYLVRYNKGLMGTQGYYITPRGASKLISESKEWFLPVDIYMDSFWINKVIPYGTLPACVSTQDEFESDIGYEQKNKRSLSHSLKREFYSLIQNFRRISFNIFNR